MPYYPEEIVEEVRSKSDIVDVIGRYVQLKKKGGTYFGLCPFHNEKTPSFSVSRSKQMYYCFGCGAGGNVITFMMEHERLDFTEAVEELASSCGVELPKNAGSDLDRQKSDRKARMLEANKDAAKFYYAYMNTPEGRRAFEYFKARGLSEATIKHFGLGASPRFGDNLYKYLRSKGYEDGIIRDAGLVLFDEQKGIHDRFWNRAMYPIMDVRGRVIGFGGRVMGEGEPKYLNSPESPIFDKSRNLYALGFARSSKRKGFIICEGYMDVIALHAAGFDNAVASLGTAFTSGHAALIKKYTDSAYVCFDSDGAGRKAALRAIPILNSSGIKVRVINMEPYKDPDEFIKGLGAEEFAKRIEQAQNAFMFRVAVEHEKYDMKDPDDKTRFFKEVSRMLLEFEENIERENYITAIADKYNVAFEDLRKLVANEALSFDPSVRRVSEPNEDTTRKKKDKPDAYKKAQGLLLTALCEDASLYDAIGKYISPADFCEDIYHQVAQKLFEQLEQGEINPARIISMFDDEQSAKVAAGLFHTTLKGTFEDDEWGRVIKDAIIVVKEKSMEYSIANMDPADMNALQNMIKYKKQIEDLKKITI